MKIYNKVVIDIATGDTLEEDSYEYDGPIAECKGEAKATLTSQQSQSFSNLSQYSSSYQNFYNTLTGYMGDRFGRQSDVFHSLTGALNQAISPGLPDINSNPGPGGTARLGGAGGGGIGGREANPNTLLQNENLKQYGYDPSLYDPSKIGFDPQAFYGDSEAAMRADATEQNAAAYQNANQAFGQRALQLGQFAPGLMAAGLSDLSASQAAGEAAGQRQVTIAGANNLQQGLEEVAQLRTQLALGQARGMSDAAQLRLQDLIARRQEALQRRAIGAGSAAASAANAERAREFNLQMQSDNFYRGIGALSSTAGLMNPIDYGQLGLGSLGGGSGIWGNTYNQTTPFMVQQANKPSIWGQLGGALLGGAVGAFTGGLGTAAMSGLGGIFSGGSGSGSSYIPYSTSSSPTGYWG